MLLNIVPPVVKIHHIPSLQWDCKVSLNEFAHLEDCCFFTFGLCPLTLITTLEY